MSTKASKSGAISLRLPRVADQLIAREAKRTGRSKGAVVGALAQEALKVQLFPGIAFRGDGWNRRAWVIGTALDVWEIVDANNSFKSPDELIEKSELTERQVRLALTYYEQFPEEIDLAIEENGRSVDDLMKMFPFAQVSYIDDQTA